MEEFAEQLKDVVNTGATDGKAIKSLCKVGRSSGWVMMIEIISPGKRKNLLRTYEGPMAEERELYVRVSQDI